MKREIVIVENLIAGRYFALKIGKSFMRNLESITLISSNEECKEKDRKGTLQCYLMKFQKFLQQTMPCLTNMCSTLK